MAKKRVIVYYMHETEQAEAARLMPFAEFTESFAIGEMDENAVNDE